MPAPHREAHDRYLQRYLDTGHRNIIGSGREVTGRRKDGSTIDLDLSVSEVRIGEQRLYIGMLRDVSARKRADEALRESEARFRRLTEMSADWYWEQDEAVPVRPVLASGMSRAAGADSANILGRTRWDVNHAAGRRSGLESPSCHAGGASAVLRSGLQERSGATRNAVVSGEPIFDANGDVSRLSRRNHQHHRARAAQEELQRHRDNLQQLVEERTQERCWPGMRPRPRTARNRNFSPTCRTSCARPCTPSSPIRSSAPTRPTDTICRARKCSSTSAAFIRAASVCSAC